MTCAICEQDRHYLGVEQSFNDPPLPPVVIEWYVDGELDFDRRYALVAKIDQGTEFIDSLACSISKKTWDKLTEGEREAWLMYAFTRMRLELAGMVA